MAEVQSKRVGHVFTVGYGKAGWIGLLIVNPENRVASPAQTFFLCI
jgi:hypothetical protein